MTTQLRNTFMGVDIVFIIVLVVGIILLFVFGIKSIWAWVLVGIGILGTAGFSALWGTTPETTSSPPNNVNQLSKNKNLSVYNALLSGQANKCPPIPWKTNEEAYKGIMMEFINKSVVKSPSDDTYSTADAFAKGDFKDIYDKYFNAGCYINNDKTLHDKVAAGVRCMFDHYTKIVDNSGLKAAQKELIDNFNNICTYNDIEDKHPEQLVDTN